MDPQPCLRFGKSSARPPGTLKPPLPQEVTGAGSGLFPSPWGGVPEAHGSYSRAREAQGLLGAHVQPLSLCPLPPGHMLLSRGPWGLQLPSEMEDSVLRCLQGQSPPLYVSPLKS
ncbi:hypothetical protein MC885_021272 [Smutsia gigantea]|nr:hypothetical protein MC885_021272 [Smutsia gigantea]